MDFSDLKYTKVISDYFRQGCSNKFFKDNNHVHFWRLPSGNVLFPKSEIKQLPFDEMYVHDLKIWGSLHSTHEFYENSLYWNYTSRVCLNEPELYECVDYFSDYLPKEKELYMLSYTLGFECFEQDNGWLFSIDYALLRSRRYCRED